MNRLFSVLAFVIAFATLNAAEPITADDNSIIVSFNSWKSESVKVDIVDTYGDIIYSERVTSFDGQKRYQLSQLPSGDYTVRTSDDLRIEKQVVSIDRGSVVDISDLTVAYKPVITASTDYIDVNYLTNGKRSSVTLVNNLGETVYTNAYNGTTLNKRFDITSLPAGEYNVIVSNGETSNSAIIRR